MTRRQAYENLMVAFDTLRSHKVRSGLTILGIVIGITSVISVAAIIDGLNRYIQQRVESIGSRTYFISRIPFAMFGRMPERIRLRKYLAPEYAEFLRESCPSVGYVTSFITRGFMFGETNYIQFAGERVERFILRGVEPEYADAIPLFNVSQGRFISRFDEDHARPVIVIGSAIADSLFGRRDPVGRSVRMNGKQYEVIGVFDPDPGMFGGPGVDQFAIIPLSLFRKHYPESKEVMFAFSVKPAANPQRAKDEVEEALRRRRHVKHNAENDFEIISPDFLSDLWSQLTGALAVLTG
ncbi:MAG: ABC transporter permease, partial [Acidobacteria bacterium]|nr:ABC transporter permease [Acidobacteriota bacterium]